MNLDESELLAVEVEALPNGLETNEAMRIEGIEITQDEDGGVTFDFDPLRNKDREDDFFDNLAEFMDDAELAVVANDLMDQYTANKASRHDWEEAYSSGLELLGFNYEERTEPFRALQALLTPCLQKLRCSSKRKHSMNCCQQTAPCEQRSLARRPRPKQSKPVASKTL